MQGIAVEYIDHFGGDLRVAYVAGLLDADGWFSICANGKERYVPSIGFTNCHLATIKEVRSLLGGFINKKKRLSSTHEQCYELQIRNSEDVATACNLLIPYIRQKRDRLFLVKEYADSIVENKGKPLQKETKDYRRSIYERYKCRVH